MGMLSFFLLQSDSNNKNNRSKFSEGDTVEIISTGEVGKIIGVNGSIYEVEIFSAGGDVDRVSESDLKLY